MAQDGGIGRNYPTHPLAGRDDEGPIFPIGDADPRLPVQSEVVGVVAPDGRAVAFPVEEALSALNRGERVAIAGVEVTADGDGLRARLPGGEELPSHQAFWFAWSQLHPRTDLWEPGRSGAGTRAARVAARRSPRLRSRASRWYSPVIDSLAR